MSQWPHEVIQDNWAYGQGIWSGTELGREKVLEGTGQYTRRREI